MAKCVKAVTEGAAAVGRAIDLLNHTRTQTNDNKLSIHRRNNQPTLLWNISALLLNLKLSSMLVVHSWIVLAPDNELCWKKLRNVYNINKILLMSLLQLSGLCHFVALVSQFVLMVRIRPIWNWTELNKKVQNLNIILKENPKLNSKEESYKKYLLHFRSSTLWHIWLGAQSCWLAGCLKVSEILSRVK